MMWKKTALVLSLMSHLVWANSNEEIQVNVWQPIFVAQQQAQAHFLQWERMLNNAIKHRQVTPTLLELARRTKPNYPLEEEMEWLLLQAKLSLTNAENVETMVQEIEQFSQKYPKMSERQNLLQRPISLYLQYEKWDLLQRYIAHTAVQGVENQCRWLSIRYQQLQELFATEQLEYALIEQDRLLYEFEKIWQHATKSLPESCEEIEKKWAEKGFQTADKFKQKALTRFEKNLVLTDIQTNDETLAQWLDTVERLRKNPKMLPEFIEQQPLDRHNRAVVKQAFGAWVKTLPEQIDQSHFARYQQWAAKFQLTTSELRDWKILFLNRAFDNEDRAFQAWRDEQLKTINADNLIERRIRMAIWQKTALEPWLALLSTEAKNKPEWRYWRAKSDNVQKARLLRELSQERGFYPMLAAHALGERYQVKWAESEPLSVEQQAHFQLALNRISALRELNRNDSAKMAWRELLQTVDFSQKLALIDYAKRQDWYDLAVEGTILAKAWDYIPLRLPNAYPDWFKWHLQNKSVSQSFAMAIARQESAWNPNARSHANALGLMQMLPSTAKQTAENQGLPFSGEQDLLQPFHNIMLGTAHLAELEQQYPNNRILIAAAYNAGSHRVTRWLKRAGGRLAMDEFIASIPFLETRGYVQNVLAYDYYYQQLYFDPPFIMFTDEEQRRY